VLINWVLSIGRGVIIEKFSNFARINAQVM